MPTLRKELRSQLEKTVLKARELAEHGAHEALSTLAVDQPKPFEHLKPEQKKLRNQLRSLGRQAGDVLDERTGRQSLEHLVGVVAYEHWHRMLFARFLAENGLLLESEHQVPVSLADVAELARDAKVDIWELAGIYAQRMLPAVFRSDDPALFLTLARETRTALEKLVADLPADVFLASDSLGWTYQFWQARRKDEVNASGVKIGADELPSVTQLFTEDYMVDFLLDNTLGAWHAGKVLAANPKLAETAQSEDELRLDVSLPGCPWNYLRFIKGKDGKWTPAAGTFSGWPKSAAALRALDPCMGSGHFVVAMFERLVTLRIAEEKLEEAAMVAAVIRENLFGLEIDPRCTQIGAFNLALAAWRRVGHCALPAMNLACSGLAPNATEAAWIALAGTDLAAQNGMGQLYRLFKNAPVLGTLINPRAVQDELLDATFHELQPLLEKALEQETRDDSVHEMAVTARGLAKASEILAGQFTLVATNVPYLGSGNQDDVLKDYCARVHSDAKADLATCFIERCLQFCLLGGSTALVTPQNWLFLGTYKRLRRRLLEDYRWDCVARLGARAFETISGEVVNVALPMLSRTEVLENQQFAAIDVSGERSATNKREALEKGRVLLVRQKAQLANPDCLLSFEENGAETLLLKLAKSYRGHCNGDSPRFERCFWEVIPTSSWSFLQSAPQQTAPYEGRHHVLFWEEGRGQLVALAEELRAVLKNVHKRGIEAWGRSGIAVKQMGKLPTCIYTGEIFDGSCATVIPHDPKHLPAVWAFCASSEFNESVRRLNQKMNVENGFFVKIPFDVAHWQQVARQRFPHGLPKPFSSDPSQWLFNGHPRGADQPLHVAVARLLGYQWPRQTGSHFPDCPALDADGLETNADADGIVCLSAVRGERGAADRLRALLSGALGKYDEQALIKATGSKAKDFDSWFREDFFEQHSALFHQRPFIWHIWDGLSDGFHALINYHQLAAPNGAGHRLLDTLTYSYLGEWIRKQQDEIKRKQAGAEDRLIAAQALQKELEAIRAGEPPYDIFVRWKPLQKQPIGWEPDINDGVRLNIRPFMMAKDVGRKGAGILRAKPNIKWEKDRGTEPNRPKSDFPWFWGWDEEAEDFAGGREFDGCRWNACHYTTAVKRAAREVKLSNTQTSVT